MPVHNKIENIYPIPILRARVEGFEFDKIQKEIGKVVEGIEWAENPALTNTQLLSSNTFGSDIIGERKLEVLGIVIDQMVKDYCKELGCYPIGPYDRESWLTKNALGDYSLVHNHGISDISGVYYYDTSGNDGDFFFQSPTPSAVVTYCLQWMHGNLGYKPENGMFMLFPSFINHGVTRNTENRDRISLAFNIKFHRGKR
jgi:hypothetical protein